MNQKFKFNENWLFSQTATADTVPDEHWQRVTLPHTWNAKDGQDGGNDYYRGTCWYMKSFERPETDEGDEVWLQLEGAAMTAEVFLNGVRLAHHEGGYSTFRINLTWQLKEGTNLLQISVDNGKNRTVYPQKADFTFYGGIYRDVTMIIVPHTHFTLGDHGAPALKVTPKVSGTSAEVTVEAHTEGNDEPVTFTLNNETQQITAVHGIATAVFHLKQVHLWNGTEDPYLYTVSAELQSGDHTEASFGCRTIAFDPEQGFLLNGKQYRLCGAARHQDRLGKGNALSRTDHEEDMALLREMGANTVRLAHYQHDQYFYDLCDRYGMIVWAEIPYISEHMEEGNANTISQMKELVLQNYNHPSIVCWGLSNEITSTGGPSSEITANHRTLNDLCHHLDPTRPTAMANVFMLDPDDPLVSLPDIRSYNLYYGWYIGELEQNDEWFDSFHASHPDEVIGLSEYGADANPAYQNGAPAKGDWSEGYQALYHEHMLKMWSERPYIWAMHCWNMFDFGADGRNEGGKPGQNQKGLVTFDRQLKKDAFYIYKAYLSKDPFVHLCGRRYAERTESVTEIKVYSNQPEVTLIVDGKELNTIQAEHVFVFNVKISGVHQIEAVSGSLHDRMEIRHVETANPSYRNDEGGIMNWFDKPEELMKEGYYSIMDTMEDLKKNPTSAAILQRIMAKATASYGDVAKNVRMPEAMQKQMDRMPLQKLLQQAGKALSQQDVKQLNAALNQIQKN